MYSSTSVSQEYISCIVKRTKKNMVTKVTVLFHIFAIAETGFLFLKTRNVCLSLDFAIQSFKGCFSISGFCSFQFYDSNFNKHLNRCNDKIYDPDNVCPAGISDHLC